MPPCLQINVTQDKRTQEFPEDLTPHKRQRKTNFPKISDASVKDPS